MKSVKEYVSNGDEKISKAIDLYNKINYTLSSNFCAICDSEMEIDDLVLIEPKDFLITCKKHRKYAGYFQTGKARLDAGFSEQRDISYEKVLKTIINNGIK